MIEEKQYNEASVGATTTHGQYVGWEELVSSSIYEDKWTIIVGMMPDYLLDLKAALGYIQGNIGTETFDGSLQSVKDNYAVIASSDWEHIRKAYELAIANLQTLNDLITNGQTKVTTTIADVLDGIELDGSHANEAIRRVKTILHEDGEEAFNSIMEQYVIKGTYPGEPDEIVETPIRVWTVNDNNEAYFRTAFFQGHLFISKKLYDKGPIALLDAMSIPMEEYMHMGPTEVSFDFIIRVVLEKFESDVRKFIGDLSVNVDNFGRIFSLLYDLPSLEELDEMIEQDAKMKEEIEKAEEGYDDGLDNFGNFVEGVGAGNTTGIEDIEPEEADSIEASLASAKEILKEQ